MIHWLIALLFSVAAGFLTASFLFSFAPIKHLFIRLGKCGSIGAVSVAVGILLIPSLAVILTFQDGMLDNHLLSIWIMTVFSSNLFIFVGIGIVDGNKFWREIYQSGKKGQLSGDAFDFCYTPADFQFINQQVSEYRPDGKFDPQKALSKIYIAYRDLNVSDYRKFILVTHLAGQLLPSRDEFWKAYREWGIDPEDYGALKRFSLQSGGSKGYRQPISQPVIVRRRETGWRPRML
ncbi:MAG: hypothetical protein GWN00_33505 [Aliifodinibius sp.]|nr:hypothetical protein [candidate division Zixibacteria bacterium]NIT60947.1 hypothetical protein [Fodinibius sp.]NIW40060.1 hypothetical protein [candidate division Zixibacteria bacterium]NIX58925.1 hypothetical protein [candidate division Zixibacteria bacterium]NIY29528.1 hypothetical protein [Fodinibius sp.]